MANDNSQKDHPAKCGNTTKIEKKKKKNQEIFQVFQLIFVGILYVIDH